MQTPTHACPCGSMCMCVHDARVSTMCLVRAPLSEVVLPFSHWHHMPRCLHVYIHTCVRARVRVRARMRACTCTCMHVSKRACTRARVCVKGESGWVDGCAGACMRACVRALMHSVLCLDRKDELHHSPHVVLQILHLPCFQDWQCRSVEEA